MKNSLILLLLLWSWLSLLPTAEGANYYWVGNGGLWTDLTHWADGPGGTGGAYLTAPTAEDNVFFDADSFDAPGQVVQLIAGDNNCYNMNWTGVTDNPVLRFPSAAARLNISYSIVLDNNMSVDFSNDPDQKIVNLLNTGIDISTFAASISTRDRQLPNVHFTGAGGIWALTETLNVAGEIKITNGTLRSGAPGTATFNINTDEFIVDGSAVVLQIDRMNITANSLFSIADLDRFIYTTKSGNTTYLSTVSTNKLAITSPVVSEFGTLNIIGEAGEISAGGQNLDFKGIVTLDASSSNTIFGSHTFSADLILKRPGIMNRLEAGSTQTFSNKSNILGDGASCANYFFLVSTVEGAVATVRQPAGNGIDVERFYIRDVWAGPQNKFSATLSVNLGNTDGWSFTAASSGTAYFWIGDTGDWSNANNWTRTGGGPPCLPTAFDDVIFDENSFAGVNHVVTVDLPAIYFNNMTWTDPSGDLPTWSIPNGSINVGGSMVLAPSMQVSIGAPAGTTFNFVSADLANTQTITAANGVGEGFNLANVVFDGPGSWSMGSELTASGSITFKDGTFDTGANYNLEAGTVSINGPTTGISFNKSEVYSTTFEVVDFGAFDAGTSNIYTQLFDITPAGMTFYQMLLQGAEGILRGEDLVFKDAILSNTVKSTVFGSHTYNNLLQFDKPGMIVEFEAETTQQMGDIESLGKSCGGEIFVRTTLSGKPVYFVALAEPIAIDYILLQDNTATPDMSFSAGISQDLGNNSGWEFTGAAAIRHFYWRGDAGNWNEGSNWLYSEVFGETPTNTDCIPTPNDDVYFDADSFTEAGRTVTLNGPEQYCRNMSWALDVVGVPIMNLPAGNQLHIYGGFQVPTKEIMTLDFGDGDNAVLLFKAKDGNPDISNENQGHSIITSDQDIPNITFAGPDGEWRLSGGIKVTSAITLINGHLRTNNRPVAAKEFLINGPGAVLSLSSSILTIEELIQIDDIGSLNAGTSSLQTNVLNCIPTGLAFNEVRMVDIGDATDQNDQNLDLDTELTGNGLTFNSLVLSGSNNNRVRGSHTFNELLDLDFNLALLTLTNVPIVYFIFDAGSTQSFAGLSTIISTNTGLAIPRSRVITNTDTDTDTGETAVFTKSGNSVCLEYISIFDIIATGGATFGYNQNNAGINPNSLGWTATTNCALLPVECTDFSATLQPDNSVKLYWTTAQEINNSGFEVQRSSDGRRFETIAWVEGKGTTAEPQKYTHTDRRTEELATAYYRLQQIDFDGTSAFACDIEAVSLRNEEAGSLMVYPNPAGAQIQLRWHGRKTGTVLLRLFDQSGRLVLNREWNTLEGSNRRELNIIELPRGIYELQLVDVDGRMQTARVVRE